MGWSSQIYIYIHYLYTARFGSQSPPNVALPLSLIGRAGRSVFFCFFLACESQPKGYCRQFRGRRSKSYPSPPQRIGLPNFHPIRFVMRLLSPFNPFRAKALDTLSAQRLEIITTTPPFFVKSSYSQSLNHLCIIAYYYPFPFFHYLASLFP